MSDGTFPGLISKDNNANALSNPIYVQLSDGTSALTIVGGALTVVLDANDGVDIGDVDVTSIIPGVGATNLGKAEDAAHASGDTGVMMLAVRQDTQVDFGADGDYVPFSIDADGALRVSGTFTVSEVDDSASFVIGTDSVSPCGYLADEVATDSVDEGDIGLARMTLDRKVLTVITDGTTDANRLSIDASGFVTANINGSVVVTATALDIRALSDATDSVSIGDGTDTLAINTDGSINTVPGVASSGSEVHDFDHATATGAGSSTNHDYTVANTTFLCSKIEVASSGKGKYTIQYGPLASLVTVLVGFLDKDETKALEFNPPLPVPIASTGTLRVIKENRQAAATDFYSTIMGQDI